MTAPSSPFIEQSSPCSDSNQPKPHRQRLVICLDGTWNKRDSGTHIYHLSNLVEKGELSDEEGKWCQLVHYDAGVGTGLLDSVSGGAFGLGLSENVREAYDFLVENYHDGDEIYIFGFSRGAFTARSLVGLISKCGLLRRGAPLPPEELWEGYRILGRHRHERTGSEPAANWWEHIVGKPRKPFREMEELRREPWEKDLNLGEPKPAQNRAEHLLVQWSRRVPITCVGVFDTVGSMGLDALAIPWLRSRTAQFHDTRLSSIVRYGFQALAIDEHRANFSHIPWHRAADSAHAGGATLLGGCIQQRWFLGAHSNVGGGYDDNVLSEYPLAWMMTEAGRLGLVFRQAAQPALAPGHAERCCPLLDPERNTHKLQEKPPSIRDSYSEFSGGVWKHIIRAKREYRRIAPTPELQNGKPVRSVNESVDPSVNDLVLANNGDKSRTPYASPNLWEYWKRHPKVAGTVGEPPSHRYLDGWKSFAMLGLWLAFIGFAGWKLGRLIVPQETLLASLLAAGFPVVAWFADWRESVLAHNVALAPDGFRAERHLAWMDVCLVVRLGAFLAFFFGVVCGVWFIVSSFTVVRPDPDLIALGILALLAVWFNSSMVWCSAPMSEAGMGSIVELQSQRTPGGVKACLFAWSGIDRKEESPEEMRHLLLPVVRAIWRDMLGFIPAYSLFIFAGTWLGASLIIPMFTKLSADGAWWDLLAPTWWALGAAALVTGLSIISDYVEDIIHLGYLKRFPADPPRAAVAIANAATFTKCAFFGLGLVMSTAAALALVWRAFQRLAVSDTGIDIVGSAIIGFTLVAFAGAGFALLGTRKPRRNGRGARKDSPVIDPASVSPV